MAFQLSPSVLVTEKDLTNIIPAVSTSTGALAGEFQWGPVGEITTVNNEEQLSSIFGKPTASAYKDFLVASSFLSYASNLKIVRAANTTGLLNSSNNADSNGGVLIKNAAHYDSLSLGSDANLFVAKCPGTFGDNIGVAWADTSGFNGTDSAGDPSWTWHDLFDSAPDTGEFHVVVYDATGEITGTSGTALERFAFVTTSSSAKYYDGTSAYFKTRINNGSAWLWVANTSLLTGSTDGVTLSGGGNGSSVTNGDRETALDLFLDAEAVDISLILQGGGSTVVGQYIIDNIAEVRKDCVALVSVEENDVVNIFSAETILTNILATRSALGSSSYAVMDSAYKLMYDRYNDVNRWVPLNGDIAGLCARTDNDADPWFSPAGLNRGRIKNAIALSNPETITTRDELYKKGVNPCVVFPVDGPVLFGDKTLLSKPSAFDRINVRRLFIVIEKAIATASKFMLFEQNDDFTRARFVNMIEPFLRDVQGRRGIVDFRVVCDDSNNTGEVIDRNEFVADIYIKPTRSINFIKLNFVALRSGVDFEEIVQGATL